MIINVRAATDALLEALYDEDEETAQVDLPPRSWRVTRAEADDLMDFARMHLDLAWRKVREDARAARLASRGRHRSFGRATGEALESLAAEGEGADNDNDPGGE